MIASDPAPGAEKRLRAAVALHWRALERIGLAAGASVERLAFAADPEDAVAAADLVPKGAGRGGPTRASGGACWRSLDREPRRRPPCSRTAFLRPDPHGDSGSLHTPRARPGRASVQPASPRPTRRGSRRRAHRSGWPSIKRWPSIRRLGSTPSNLSTRSPATSPTGFRLRCGEWCPTSSSVVSPRSPTSTPPSPTGQDCVGAAQSVLNLHLSGGDGGLRHVLEHLGPPIERWWDDLGDPRLTSGLCGTAIEGVEQELDGLDLTDLVARRDELLIDLLRARGAAKELP